MTPTIDKAALVRDAVGGDGDAARRLVVLLTPVVRARAARALLRRGRRAGRSIDQELEDLTQDVLLALFDDDGRRLRAWSPEFGPIEGFVGLLAEREVSSILRSGRRSPWRDDPLPDEDLERRKEVHDGAEAQLASRDMLVRLLDKLRERLSPQGLRIFYALFAEDKSVEAVCEELHMQPDAVYAWRSRLARLSRTLAAELENSADGLSEKPGPRRLGLGGAS